ncbi:LptF/LptG family permease [Pelagibacteraceae bacterium]|nr:LptF/LptG family permease [Pelagibacteraceae bacterium]
MTKILFKYIINNYLQTIFKVILIFYCFGLILNLFEEIEFFKELGTSVIMPLTLTALFVPNLIIKLLPFVIFISSMWFLLNLRNSKNLLDLKVFGYSNFKIFCILAFTSFVFGWFILIVISPFTSVMTQYYEKTKSQYSKDVDHLIAINKNGMWIKENLENGHRIITASDPQENILENITIYNFKKNYEFFEKIKASTANISEKNWKLKNVKIIKVEDGLFKENLLENFSLYSKYNYAEIVSLFKNFDTMSFIDLIVDYKKLQNKGYNKIYLDQNLNTMLAMPFFLLIMTALASILTMNTLRKSNNFTFIVVGLIACVGIYYFKDLSMALGQTNRVSLSLAAWIPIVALGFFSSIGILQINEK